MNGIWGDVSAFRPQRNIGAVLIRPGPVHWPPSAPASDAPDVLPPDEVLDELPLDEVLPPMSPELLPPLPPDEVLPEVELVPEPLLDEVALSEHASTRNNVGRTSAAL
jgi:hypothetical protein